MIFGFIPVGIAYGIMAQQAGLLGGETVAMSIFVFAGASQMMAVGMYGQGAGFAAIILATLMLNLRHLIMSTCVMNRIKPCGIGFKLLAAFGVTDESFALFTTESESRATPWFFLGLITVTYTSWVTGSFLGAIAATLLPSILSASLGIALYAMFIGLMIPGVRENFHLGFLVVLTAVVNSALSQVIPFSWALILSTLLCAGVGVVFVSLNEEETEEL